MLKQDFDAVESIILKRITRIRLSFEKVHNTSEPSEEAELSYQQSVKPLKDALEVLRNGYFKNYKE